MRTSGSDAPKTGPMVIPAETGIPTNRRSGLVSSTAGMRAIRLCWGAGGSDVGGGSILFIEAGLDQGGQGIERFLRVPAFGAKLDRGAAAGTQHHQAHDRAGGHGLPVAQNINRCPESLGHGDEFRCCTGMQATFVGDRDSTAKDRCARRRQGLAGGRTARTHPQVPLMAPLTLQPCRTWDAAAIYLRPASSAQFTASAK